MGLLSFTTGRVLITIPPSHNPAGKVKVIRTMSQVYTKGRPETGKKLNRGKKKAIYLNMKDVGEAHFEIRTSCTRSILTKSVRLSK